MFGLLILLWRNVHANNVLCVNVWNQWTKVKGKTKMSKYLESASRSTSWVSFCAFVFMCVCVAGVGRLKISLVEFQAGDVNGDNPSSTDEVSPY